MIFIHETNYFLCTHSSACHHIRFVRNESTISAPSGTGISINDSLQQIVGEAVTAVLKWMGDIVDYKAQSNKVAIMGKTGSLRLDENGRKHRISFVGIFPENDPQYTCMVMFNAPKNFPFYDAGMDCGSTVRIIAESILKK